ncbi:MAG: outer membrane beta-barrel protein [Gammaproteobacteria bacterium]|nr:outer membrane beta-barrel protein [Gammaproteobacteria bacterium]
MDIKPSTSLAMEHTNNARKVTYNRENDLIMIGSVGASLNEDTGPFKLDANTSLTFMNYTQDTFDNQQYFNLNAVASWEMLKDRLDWILQDFYTQQSINSLNPDTPDNTSDTNILTFGPNIYYRISGRQSVTFKPEYRQFDYESQVIDNKQNSLDVSWNYQLFRTMNVGVRGGNSKVDYKDPLIPDNVFRNIHLTLSATRPDYNYSADIGSTHIEKESGDSIRGITGNMRWSLNITGYSNLHTYIASDLTDANNSLLNASINPNDGDFSTEQLSSEILRNHIFRLTYQRSDAKLSSNFWLELRNQDYEFALIDREVQAAGFEFKYPLTAILSTGINTRYSNIELTDVDRLDTEYSIGGYFNYRFSRNLHGVVDLKYFDIDSSVDTADFSETSFFIGLVYGQ